MYKPKLDNLQSQRDMITAFGGFCNKKVLDENCFQSEGNLTSDSFPVFSPRNKRAFFNVSGEGLHGLFSKNKICYIKDNSLYYGGERVSGIYFPDIQGERRFVSMGARVIVFPDKFYFNTADFTDYGYLEAEFNSVEGTNVTASLCKADGDLYEDYSISATAPENAVNGALWLDTSVTPNELKQYSETISGWFSLAETYIRISCSGIGKSFKQYDGVTVSGIENDNLNGMHILRDVSDDYITVTGMITNTVNQTTPVKVERKVPDMDFICENGNRLWGCNSQNNEIYASKLGDPTNFNSFMGISSDSYAVSVGTDGEFTGAVSYRGYVLFFKEFCVHKIYGMNPPYTVNTSYIRGVQKGSSSSLVTVNETLYYKSPKGVCSFEGGVPVSVSEDLGNEYYTDAAAGALGDKYYICMSDKNKKRHLFVFDEAKRIWHREDEIDVTEFANHNGNLYFIAYINGEKRLCLADGVNRYGNFTNELSGYCEEDDFEWYAETGLWGLSIPENKYYSKIIFRVYGKKGSFVKIDFQTDLSGKWETQKEIRIDKTGSFVLPFASPRCDVLKMRISGKGEFNIYSISREIQTGSELNV